MDKKDNNEIAIQVSINIMDAFVEMRKFISNNRQVFERLTNVEYKLLEHDKIFNIVFNELQAVISLWSITKRFMKEVFSDFQNRKY